MKATPVTSHCNRAPFLDSVYPPSEDTYLFLDGLESELQTVLKPRNPSTCLEIGSGSGCVSSFLAMHLDPNLVYITTDINPLANRATSLTVTSNSNATVDCVTTSLVNGIRLRNQFDLVLFNPPYVPSHAAEVGLNHALAYAGGERGRQVIDQIMPLLHHLLSPSGLAYFVFVEENDLEQLEHWMWDDFRLSMTVCLFK